MPGSGKGVVGDEHLVALAYSEREQCQVQSGGAVVDRDRVGDTTALGEGLFERAGPGTLAGDPARSEHLVDGVQLGRTERGESERDIASVRVHESFTVSPPNQVSRR